MLLETSSIVFNKIVALVASLGGAILSLAFMRGVSWKVALLAIGSGFLCAYFFTDDIAATFGLEHGSVGFGLGLVSMNLLAGIMSLLQEFGKGPKALLKFFSSLKDKQQNENDKEKE